MKFVVKVCDADIPNKNHRIYPKEVLEEQVRRFNQKAEPMVGCTGTPASNIVELNKISHQVTKLYMEGSSLMAEIEILQTPAGKDLEALVSAGINIGFRMSGTGDCKKIKKGGYIIGNYTMTQIFATNDPA